MKPKIVFPKISDVAKNSIAHLRAYRKSGSCCGVKNVGSCCGTKCENCGLSIDNRKEFFDKVIAYKRSEMATKKIVKKKVAPIKKQPNVDPNGIDQHQAGAKLDSGKTRTGMMVSGFARALHEVAKVSTYGAEKYTPNGWLSVPDGEARYTDAMYRHFFREACGEAVDEESGMMHAAHAAWNALARLELELRRKENARHT